jgi:hypothetical protein
MELTTKLKYEIVKKKKAVPNATNDELSELYGLSKQQVSGVVTAYKLFGGDWVSKLTAKLGISEEVYSGFSNFDGDGKLGARGRILLAIDFAKIRVGKILTLPSSEWKMERMINQISKRFNYIACENNLEYFKKMVAKSDWYGTKNECHQVPIGDLIFQAKEDEYSHLILDYCGRIESFQKEIKYACENNIVKKGGVIAVTLFKTRSNAPIISKLNQLHSDMTGQHIKMNDNENAIKMFFHCLSAMTEFEVVEEFTYNDGSPMILVILKRR